MAGEDVKIVIKQKGTIPVYTKTKVGVAEVHHDESLEGKGTVIDPLKVSENIIVDIDSRVEKTSQADKVYGTDAQGNQTTYDVDGFGKVDDVQINDTSVVQNKIAKITVDSTIEQDSTNPVDGGAVFDALAEKQDNLPSLEDGKFLSNDGTDLVWREIPAGMTYKGQIETPEDLPETATVGDMYNCISNGKNYIWNGESWDELATPSIDDSNLVHKTGAETIAGNKTFTSPMVVQTNNTWGLDVKSTSSGGYLYVTRGSGANMCRFAIKAGVNGGTIGTDTNSKFSIRVNNINKMTFEKNGDIKLAANPASSSNDTQIATTKWVNDKLSSSSIYIYKGTVADLEALEEIANPSVGDVYFVVSENTNYAWNGSIWGSLGETFEIDNTLSTTSENAVQNKVITTALEEKAIATKTPDIDTYEVSNGYLKVTPQAAQEGEELESVNIIGIESSPQAISGSQNVLIASSIAQDIYSQIEDLKGLGRFLTIWDCTTGLPTTNPQESPYVYKTGDYYLVGSVGTRNYRPTGTSYTTDVPSTVVETEPVKTNDVYIFDGTNWVLQANVQRDVTFTGIQGSPYDNTSLATALNAKQDVLVSGTNIKTINNTSILGSGNIATLTSVVYNSETEELTIS